MASVDYITFTDKCKAVRDLWNHMYNVKYDVPNAPLPSKACQFLRAAGSTVISTVKGDHPTFSKAAVERAHRNITDIYAKELANLINNKESFDTENNKIHKSMMDFAIKRVQELDKRYGEFHSGVEDNEINRHQDAMENSDAYLCAAIFAKHKGDDVTAKDFLTARDSQIEIADDAACRAVKWAIRHGGIDGAMSGVGYGLAAGAATGVGAAFTVPTGAIAGLVVGTGDAILDADTIRSQNPTDFERNIAGRILEQAQTGDLARDEVMRALASIKREAQQSKDKISSEDLLALGQGAKEEVTASKPTKTLDHPQDFS